MTDFADAIFPNSFGINVKVMEEFPNSDLVSRIKRRYPVPLRSVPFITIEVEFPPRRQQAVDVIRAFFIAMNGTQHTFRIKNPADNTSSDPESTPTNLDQNIGTGDGANPTFQLRKGFTAGSSTVYKSITQIVALSDVVAVAGVAKTRGVHYNIVNATGVITFTGGNIPTGGQAVTAGYRYLLKCRFADDVTVEQFVTHNRMSLDNFGLKHDDR